MRYELIDYEWTAFIRCCRISPEAFHG